MQDWLIGWGFYLVEHRDMKNPKIVQLIKSSTQAGKGLVQLSNETGVSKTTLRAIQSGRRGKFRKQSLDTLYEHFGLEPDEYYEENMKQRHKPDFSVIGNILRCMRLEKWLSVDDVAKSIKWTAREIRRIEAGDHLPSYRGRYMVELLKLYGATEQEQELIRWWVVILKDLMQINNRYDPIKENMTLKKTVVVV